MCRVARHRCGCEDGGCAEGQCAMLTKSTWYITPVQDTPTSAPQGQDRHTIGHGSDTRGVFLRFASPTTTVTSTRKGVLFSVQME